MTSIFSQSFIGIPSLYLFIKNKNKQTKIHKKAQNFQERGWERELSLFNGYGNKNNKTYGRANDSTEGHYVSWLQWFEGEENEWNHL